jgi:hypothetical protein
MDVFSDEPSPVFALERIFVVNTISSMFEPLLGTPQAAFGKVCCTKHVLLVCKYSLDKPSARASENSSECLGYKHNSPPGTTRWVILILLICACSLPLITGDLVVLSQPVRLLQHAR